MAILKKIDELLTAKAQIELAEYEVFQTNDECLLLKSLGSGNSFEIWEIGDWLQVRCEIFNFGHTNFEDQMLVLRSVNRLQDVASGYRFTLSDAGELALLTDILKMHVDAEQIAIYLNQAQFLIDSLLDFFSTLMTTRSPLSNETIDAIFEQHGAVN